jgi:hypothetical protein
MQRKPLNPLNTRRIDNTPLPTRLDGAANMAGTIGKKHGTGKFVDQDDAEWDMLMRLL